VTADTLDFGACLFRCVSMGQLREHSFELKGYLVRTNIIPHFLLLVVSGILLLAVSGGLLIADSGSVLLAVDSRLCGIRLFGHGLT
jgi:hypothetical protein